LLAALAGLLPAMLLARLALAALLLLAGLALAALLRTRPRIALLLLVALRLLLFVRHQRFSSHLREAAPPTGERATPLRGSRSGGRIAAQRLGISGENTVERGRRRCRMVASLLRLMPGNREGGGRMEYFIQQLINGITLGSIYGLIAIGYTMVYGIIGMINFAHGDIFMVGAFTALIAFLLLVAVGVTAVPLALFLVLLAAMALTALYGWTVERIAYRPLRHSFRLAPLISAIGMSIVLQNYVQVAQGARVKPLPPLVQGGYTVLEGHDFAVRLSNIQIIVVVTTLLLMLGFSFLVARTRLGRNMRACEQDLKMAALVGVDVDRTISTTFVLGAALAAVAGLMFLLYYGVIDFFIGFLAGVKAFTAAVLGGIGSLPGAMIGGILIGLIETLWSAYFSIEYKDVAAFSILIIALIFLPTGILGRPEVEKV
jgi:branched-chain amino acid transport system permease protein